MIWFRFVDRIGKRLCRLRDSAKPPINKSPWSSDFVDSRWNPSSPSTLTLPPLDDVLDSGDPASFLGYRTAPAQTSLGLLHSLERASTITEVWRWVLVDARRHPVTAARGALGEFSALSRSRMMKNPRGWVTIVCANRRSGELGWLAMEHRHNRCPSAAALHCLVTTT
jgi:hypothetical protein